MSRVSCSWFFILLFSVQALQHSLIGATETAPPPSFPSLSEQDKSWLRNSSSVSSDFDGDGTPDLAIGRFDGQNYNIEIQLSAQRANTSLAFGRTELGICLLVRDVDLDNDQDLVLVNYTSLLPLAIWLNDGKANFKKGNQWLWLDLITPDNALGDDPAGFSVSSVSITENYRLPLDRSVTGFLAAKLPFRKSLVNESQTLHLLVLPYHSSVRGPPHSS